MENIQHRMPKSSKFWMFFGCSLDVLWMFFGCSALDVRRWMFDGPGGSWGGGERLHAGGTPLSLALSPLLRRGERELPSAAMVVPRCARTTAFGLNIMALGLGSRQGRQGLVRPLATARPVL